MYRIVRTLKKIVRFITTIPLFVIGLHISYWTFEGGMVPMLGILLSICLLFSSGLQYELFPSLSTLGTLALMYIASWSLPIILIAMATAAYVISSPFRLLKCLNTWSQSETPKKKRKRKNHYYDEILAEELDDDDEPVPLEELLAHQASYHDH